MSPDHRFLLLWAALCLGLSLGAVASAPVAAAQEVPYRAFQAPLGDAIAWVTPGPGPELWVRVSGESYAIMRGQSEHYVAVEWAPDGKRLAVLVVPTGTETAKLGRWWIVDIAGKTPARPSAVTPSWVTQAKEPEPKSPAPQTSIPTALTPPATIRVYHGERNTCRNLPVGTISVIPFEEYVARVLPAEVWASWPAATLQAQAIAIRTYGWYQILHNRPDYDVTDTTSHQYMCDNRYASTDAAVAATTGRYLAYNGQIILAQYSAENGHPTLSGNLPYLQPVMDPVSIGEERNGHGHGLSQWGARRWAGSYGWSANQILAHYYTGVQIVDPVGADPLLTVLNPWPGTWLTGATGYLTAHGYYEYMSAVTFQAPGFAFQDSIGSDGWSAAWNLPASAGPLAVTITGNGRSHTANYAGVDHSPPAAQLSLPASSPDPTITVHISAVDSGPSGVAMLSTGADWQIRASDFSRESGAGEVISDAGAINGSALWLPQGLSSRWAGSVPASFAVGSIFQAYARVRTPDLTGSVARLELFDPADNRLLGFRDLAAGDWQQAGEYQEFTIDFWLAQGSSGALGARIISSGSTGVGVDRIRILNAPQPFQTSITWILEDLTGPQHLFLKVLDGAGNPSADLIATSRLGSDVTPPGSWELMAPAGWVTTGLQPLITARVVDDASGIDPTSTEARFSVNNGESWSGWQAAASSVYPNLSAELSFTLANGLPGEGNQVQFRAADLAGQTSTSPVWTVRIDLDPPAIAADFVGIPNAAGWITTPVTLTLSADDAISGLANIWYAASRDAGSTQAYSDWQAYTAPLVFSGEGIWMLHYRAEDRAGLFSPEGYLTWQQDMVPPVAVISVPGVVFEGSPVVVSWSAIEGNSVAWFDIQMSLDGENWQDWHSHTEAGAATYAAMPPHPIYFRARARDVAGHQGDWSAAQPARLATSYTACPLIQRQAAENQNLRSR